MEHFRPERRRAHVLRYARTLAADPADEGPAQVRLAAELFAGHLAVLDGRTDAGLTRLRTVRAQLVGGQAPAPGLPGVATRLLLEGYAMSGQPAAGLALTSARRSLAMGRGTKLWEAEIRRLRATFLAAGGAPAAEVEAELERALAVARRQRARAFEARIRRNAHGTLSQPGWCPVDDQPEEER